MVAPRVTDEGLAGSAMIASFQAVLHIAAEVWRRESTDGWCGLTSLEKRRFPLGASPSAQTKGNSVL